MQISLLADRLTLTYKAQGSGRPYLLLHGGAGPQSMAGLAAALSANGHVVAPVHPGFAGTSRPDWFNRIPDLATAYLALIEALSLEDVVLVGNSIGGWIAAEMALRASPRISAMVLLNACGIEGGIADPMKLEPRKRAACAFHDPARYALIPDTPEAAAAMAANQQTLRVYAGEPFMHDPALRGRLSALALPSVVVWGESDRIVDLDYGRRFAQAIPDARFVPVPEAGHFPQIEQLDRVMELIEALSAPAVTDWP